MITRTLAFIQPCVSTPALESSAVDHLGLSRTNHKIAAQAVLVVNTGAACAVFYCPLAINRFFDRS
jgi:hypothetical protein